jgi:hypothetical protein
VCTAINSYVAGNGFLLPWGMTNTLHSCFLSPTETTEGRQRKCNFKKTIKKFLRPISRAGHWTMKSGSKKRHIQQQHSNNKQHPKWHLTTRNQLQQPTATPKNQQAALDNRHPTTNNYHQQIHWTTKTETRQPSVKKNTERKYSKTRLEATTPSPVL